MLRRQRGSCCCWSFYDDILNTFSLWKHIITKIIDNRDTSWTAGFNLLYCELFMKHIQQLVLDRLLDLKARYQAQLSSLHHWHVYVLAHRVLGCCLQLLLSDLLQVLSLIILIIFAEFTCRFDVLLI